MAGITKPFHLSQLRSNYKYTVRAVEVTDLVDPAAGPKVIDGVTLAVGDRVLFAGATSVANNGIWLVTVVGDTSVTLVRDWDNQGAASAPPGRDDDTLDGGIVVAGPEGASLKNTVWLQTSVGGSPPTFLIDVDGQLWVRIAPTGAPTQFYEESDGVLLLATPQTWQLTNTPATPTTLTPIGDSSSLITAALLVYKNGQLLSMFYGDYTIAIDTITFTVPLVTTDVVAALYYTT